MFSKYTVSPSEEMRAFVRARGLWQRGSSFLCFYVFEVHFDLFEQSLAKALVSLHLVMLQQQSLGKQDKGKHGRFFVFLKLDVPVLWFLLSGFKLIFSCCKAIGQGCVLRVLGWTPRL